MTDLELNDFYSSAYLIAVGYELKEIYKVGSQTTFVFEGSEEAREALGGYYAMSATVNASSYAQEIKKLKTIIHQNSNIKPNTNAYGRKESCL